MKRVVHGGPKGLQRTQRGPHQVPGAGALSLADHHHELGQQLGHVLPAPRREGQAVGVVSRKTRECQKPPGRWGWGVKRKPVGRGGEGEEKQHQKQNKKLHFDIYIKKI